MSTAIARNLMADMNCSACSAPSTKSSTTPPAINPATAKCSTRCCRPRPTIAGEKTGYRIKAAKFTLRPAFEDIDFTASRSITKTRSRNSTACSAA